MKPLALLASAVVIVLVSAFSMPTATQKTASEILSIDPLTDGQEIYLTRCTSCHQMNGEGVPGVFPPLQSSEFVNGEKDRLIKIILNGMSGEVTVNGVTYNGMMPPWGSFLDDQQVADVLTYIRSNFGNSAEAVTPDEVAAVRAEVKDRKATWTIEELGGH